MEERQFSLAERFQVSSFSAAKRSNKTVTGDESEVSATSDDITSFFVDSSGRSSFSLPLRLVFEKEKDLEEVLAANCFDPPPGNLISKIKQTEDGNDDGDNSGGGDEAGVESHILAKSATSASLAFEVENVPSDRDELNQVIVEGVSVLSCSIKNLVVTFKTKITVRSTTHGSLSNSATTSTDSPVPMSPSRFSSSLITPNTMKNSSYELKQQEQLQQINLSTSFKITPVLTIENSAISYHTGAKTKNGSSQRNFSPDLRLLGLTAIPDQMQFNSSNVTASSILRTSNDRVHETRLSPVAIGVTLTNAFAIAVQSISGPKSRIGDTLISLSIQHSKTHNLPVTITNIAVHPGHSRHNVVVARKNKNINNSKTEVPHEVQMVVSNMTEFVEWGYAPKTELKLPLTLHPHEAYSTVIYISAGEERNSRQFLSPISVTGVIGMNTNIDADSSDIKADNRNEIDGREQCRVVVASDAYWTTKTIAIEPADAFRIDMCTTMQTVQRGEPMVIKLRIFNLSLESRNLMIFMAKKDQSSSTKDKSVAVKEKSVNAAVVTESNGYTFGVWGISGDDDGTVRLNRDHELLAIDTALVLGEVQGQHAVDAELRFVPLRLGRLKVPNWKLYDKGANRWYSCSHDLSILAL